MENKLTFRNHPSVILENSLKTIGTVVFIFVLNFISDIDETGIQFADVALLIGVLIGGTALIIGFHALIWARTYITIEENTLVVERNTINKNRNNIGLKNISNVNLEQNMLEMILGTCKVKLDTNSLSTADETDVNIVLKKADAENFRRIVLGQSIESTRTAEITEESTPVIGDMGDIILHGLFSIRISTIIALLAVVLIQIGLLQDLGMYTMQEIFAEIVGGLFATIWVSGALVWSIVKEFFKYLNFRIERKKDKVFLNYGLFKKVAYSVPADKINGIRLTQTPIARMAKRYMVEIINVGMDDDENETNTFFLPYSKIETVQNQLHILLPEFDGAIDIKEEKQPTAIWLLSVPWFILYMVIVAVVYTAMATYLPELKTAVFVVAIVILLWRLTIKMAAFLTKGIAVHDQFLKIVDGGFAKRTLFVKYDKIQYVTGRQCIIAKHFKIQKGTISLLASMKNRIHELPYFKENDMEVLKNRLI